MARRRPLLHLTCATLLAAGLASGSAAGAAPAAGTYANPVTDEVSRSFGSPTVLRGRDGHWYAYGPATDIGTERHYIPIIKSADLLTWQHVADGIPAAQWPSWVRSPDAAQYPGTIWAPAAEYFNGRYYLYYTAVNADCSHLAECHYPNRAVGVRTAPAPTGPWTDLGRALLEPEFWDTPSGARQFRSIMDADAFTAADGTRYLYYGGFKGGIYVTPLSDDGLSAVGTPTKLTKEYTYEGAYVVRRGSHYYLFGSPGGCCDGPASAYSVFAGRSTSPTGPFEDRYGAPLNGVYQAGGTPVLAPNGNKWTGTGHNAVLTDDAGQPWFTYNGIDRFDTQPGTGRPMLLDRLDWIGGWPTVRAGHWASAGSQQAPVTSGLVDDAFEGASLSPIWSSEQPNWELRNEAAGGYVHTGDHTGFRALYADAAAPANLRLRGAVRLPAAEADGAGGFVLFDQSGSLRVRVLIDRSAGALVLYSARDGVEEARVTAPLPASFQHGQWHELDVEVRGQQLSAEVSDAGLDDPVTTAAVTLSAGLGGGRFGLVSGDAATDVDAVTLAELHTPVTDAAPDPVLGTLRDGRTDEFNGPLETGWSWIRDPGPAVASVSNGQLRFGVQSADLAGTGNDAAVLWRTAPTGTWTVETKVSLDFLGMEPAANPQAGLAVHVGDNLYLRLTRHAHGAARHVTFHKEMTHNGELIRDSAHVGPPDQPTWLRLHHTIDPVSGDHVLRAGSSQDGLQWRWAGAYTLPGSATLKIGLVSHSAGADGVYTAEFDHFRVYEP